MPVKPEDPAQEHGIPEDHPAKFFMGPNARPDYKDPIWTSFGYQDPAPQTKVEDVAHHPSNPVPTSLLFSIDPSKTEPSGSWPFTLPSIDPAADSLARLMGMK